MSPDTAHSANQRIAGEPVLEDNYCLILAAAARRHVNCGFYDYSDGPTSSIKGIVLLNWLVVNHEQWINSTVRDSLKAFIVYPTSFSYSMTEELQEDGSRNILATHGVAKLCLFMDNCRINGQFARVCS